MAKVISMDIQGTGYPMAGLQLQDDLVFNGVMYDINNLYPVPFKDIKIKCQQTNAMKHLTGTVDFNMVDNEASIQPKGSSCYFARGRRSGNFTYGGNFIVDSANSAIGYYISNEGNVAAGQLEITRVNLTTKEILGRNIVTLSCTDAKFISQTSNTLFIAANNTTSTYYNYHHYAISKADFSTTDSAANTGHRYSYNIYMTENENTAFCAYSSAYGTNSLRCTVIDKGTPALATYTTLQDSPNTGMDVHTIPSQVRALDVDTDAAYTVWPAASAGDGFEIYKLTFNKGLGTHASTICSLDFTTTSGVSRAGSFVQSTGIDSSIRHEAWMVTVSGASDDYVCFSVSEDAYYTAEPAATFKIYVLKIDTVDTDLIYLTSIDPSVRIRNIMPLEEDWSKIIVVHDAGLKIYTWNSGTETYDYTSEYSVSVASVMIDRAERIWVLDNTSTLHMFSASSPIRVTVTMDSATYNYTGTTINTHADVSAWNFDNERVAVDVKLVLEGAAEFTDTSKSYTFTASASADTQVNINITGSSYSRVIASVVV